MGVLEIEASLVWTEGPEVTGAESRETRKGSLLNCCRRARKHPFIFCPLGTDCMQGLPQEWAGLISAPWSTQSGRQRRERTEGQGPGATGGNEVEGDVGWKSIPMSGLCKGPGARGG